MDTKEVGLRPKCNRLLWAGSGFIAIAKAESGIVKAGVGALVNIRKRCLEGQKQFCAMNYKAFWSRSGSQ